MATLDREKLIAQRNKYLEFLEGRSPEDLQLHLAAMADALRMILSLSPIDTVVPHRLALGFLMEAVALDIEDKPNKRQLVLENGTVGLDMLRHRLS